MLIEIEKRPEGIIRELRNKKGEVECFFAVPAGDVERPIRCDSYVKACLALRIAPGRVIEKHAKGTISKYTLGQTSIYWVTKGDEIFSVRALETARINLDVAAHP